MTDKKIVSAVQFLEVFIALWNSTHGSEWNKSAACFVKAGKVWDKKAATGELRVYFSGLDQCLTLKQREGKITSVPTKYGIDKKVVEVLKAVSAQYKCEDPKGKILWQENEDGIIAPAGQHEPGAHIVREWYH